VTFHHTNCRHCICIRLLADLDRGESVFAIYAWDRSGQDARGPRIEAGKMPAPSGSKRAGCLRSQGRTKCRQDAIASRRASSSKMLALSGSVDVTKISIFLSESRCHYEWCQVESSERLMLCGNALKSDSD